MNSSYKIADFHVGVFSGTKFPRIVLIGYSHSDKGGTVKTICHSLKGQYRHVFVHAISEPQEKFYETFIPPNRISSERNFDNLRKTYEEHRKSKKLYETKVASGEMSMDKAQKECQMLIILDDLDFLGDRVFYDDLIKQIWMNGHHDWITVVVTLHSTEGVGPIVRNRADWIVAFSDPFVANQKRLYEKWIRHFPSFRDFKEVYSDITGEYKCMVACKLRGGRTDVESNIFSWAPSRIEEGSFSFVQ